MTAPAQQAPDQWSSLPRGPSAGMLLLAYACWLANAAFGLLAAAELRAAVKLLGIPFRWGQYTFTLVDQVVLIVLGLGWLVWVLVMESLYRKAAGRGLRAMLRRVARTTAILLGAIVLAVLEQRLLGF